MGLFDFFEKKRENKRKRELVREAKEKLPELIKLRNKKYPKEWYKPKSVECEDGETRELLYDDWGIISCDCGKVKVEEIIPKEKNVNSYSKTIGLDFAMGNFPRPFNKEIEKSKMFNSKGKKLNTKEIIALWDRARKERDEFNDLRSEIDRLETILGEKFPRTKIRFNYKSPRSRNLKMINDSCFENREGFSGLIDGVEYFDGCKEPITQEKTYYENGELKEEYHVNKNGKWHGSYKLYYPNKQLKVELSYTNGIQDDGEIISYHDNGKISRKATLLNGNFHSVYQEWYSNGNFKKLGTYLPSGKEIIVDERDENGNSKEKATEENILDNQNIIEDVDEKNPPKLIDQERQVLKHEIMTKGLFMFENSSGDYIEVFGQRHTLFLEYQFWSDEYNDWVEGDREEVDSFHLTEYEDGYSFCEDELCKFFNIDESPEWDSNGVSFDWCGIDDDDDNDERKKKWNEYKNKFPKIDSIEKFNIENIDKKNKEEVSLKETQQQNIIEMQTEPELTKEMIECIKTVIIPRCIRWGINSSEEYIKANEEYEVDNVDLFQDLWGMDFFSNTDEVLKINRNDFADEDEYQEERERRFEEEFGVGEDQMTINLGMDYLEDNEW